MEEKIEAIFNLLKSSLKDKGVRCSRVPPIKEDENDWLLIYSENEAFAISIRRIQ